MKTTSVAFDSSLTQEKKRKIENIQKTSLMIILQEEFVDYQSACLLTGLSTLVQRRENRRLLENRNMSRFFPRVPNLAQQELRDSDIFQVNIACGAKYQLNCALSDTIKQEFPRPKYGEEKPGV